MKYLLGFIAIIAIIAIALSIFKFSWAIVLVAFVSLIILMGWVLVDACHEIGKSFKDMKDVFKDEDWN